MAPGHLPGLLTLGDVSWVSLTLHWGPGLGAPVYTLPSCSHRTWPGSWCQEGSGPLLRGTHTLTSCCVQALRSGRRRGRRRARGCPCHRRAGLCTSAPGLGLPARGVGARRPVSGNLGFSVPTLTTHAEGTDPEGVLRSPGRPPFLEPTQGLSLSHSQQALAGHLVHSPPVDPKGLCPCSRQEAEACPGPGVGPHSGLRLWLCLALSLRHSELRFHHPRHGDRAWRATRGPQGARVGQGPCMMQWPRVP